MIQKATVSILCIISFSTAIYKLTQLKNENTQLKNENTQLKNENNQLKNNFLETYSVMVSTDQSLRGQMQTSYDTTVDNLRYEIERYEYIKTLTF